MPQLRRTVLWNRVDQQGAEYFGLWSHEDGWELRGTVVIVLDGDPTRVRYGLICDAQWRTRAVHVAMRATGPEQALHLEVDAEQRWSTRTAELTDLQGCFDIDLSITPATTTPLIRRLSLGVGQTRSVSAAVLSFPDLRIEAIQQEYSRVEERLYRLESGGYACELEVDDLGLIVRHGHRWYRIASRDASADD